MKQRGYFWLVCVFSLLLPVLLAGCPIEYTEGSLTQPPPPPPPGEYLPAGTIDGTETGFGDGWARTHEFLVYYGHLFGGNFGAPMEITITVLDGRITAVGVFGPHESNQLPFRHFQAAYNWAVPRLLAGWTPATLMDSTSPHYFMDAGTGATMTVRGILQGATAALALLQ